MPAEEDDMPAATPPSKNGSDEAQLEPDEDLDLLRAQLRAAQHRTCVKANGVARKTQLAADTMKSAIGEAQKPDSKLFKTMRFKKPAQRNSADPLLETQVTPPPDENPALADSDVAEVEQG